MKRKLVISMLVMSVLLFNAFNGNINVYAEDGLENDSTEIVVDTDIDITKERDVEKGTGETITQGIGENEGGTDISNTERGLEEESEVENTINEVTAEQTIECLTDTLQPDEKEVVMEEEIEAIVNEVTTGQAINYIDRVFDITTGKGIESVDVTAINKATGDLHNCLTDNEGYFKLNLIVGDYILILKRAGYKEIIVDISIK